MKLCLSIAALLALAGCGGAPPPETAPAVTIAEPLQYLAQSVASDGDPATPLTSGSPWTYERFDYGGYQAEQTFLDAAGAATIWSYPPFGPFVAANGDGGETYQASGGAYYITSTQDGSKPGVQSFPPLVWWLFDQHIPACGAGWEVNGIGRACHESMTFPATGVPGNAITADTIVSEHYDGPGLSGNMERIYLAQGWGRLAWQAWRVGCAPVAASRAPAISYDGAPAENASYIKCDERLNTNIAAPPDTKLSGAAFGWPP